MKRFTIILCVLLTFGIANTTSAQNVSVHINIDNQPAWGPIGYDFAEFYYFPDINIYYDINHSLFYYPSRRAWIASQYLPYKYHIYDLYGMYKVVINGTPQPWLYNKTHRRAYGIYKGDRTQIAIRYSTSSRYDRGRHNEVHWIRPGDYQPNRPSINHSDDRRPSSDRVTNRPNNSNRPDQNRPSQSRPDRPNNNNRPNDSGRPSSSGGQSSGRR